MKKKNGTAIFITRLLSICVLYTAFALLFTTCYLEGDINALRPGTPGNPFDVHDDETLRKVGTGKDGWDMNRHYRQIDDIVLSPAPWDPIGTELKPFEGNYDGQGHKISKLTIDSHADENQGLFGYIKGPNVQVKNVRLENVDINCNKNVGGVAGYVADGGRVTNCHSTGKINSNYNVGGVAGYVEDGGRITNCSSTVEVDGNENVGGVAGYIDGGSITNCSSTAEVSGNEYVGGVAGYVSRSSITNCYSSGTISDGDFVGGVAGYVDGGDITNCHSTAVVSGDKNVGGVAGHVNGVDDIDYISVENCYSTGTVTGNISVGGVVGSNENEGNVTTCFSTGIVIGATYVGGVVGINNKGKVINCYSTSEVMAKSITHSGGVTGLNQNGGKVTNCYSTGQVGSVSGMAGGIVGQNADDTSTVKNCVALGPSVITESASETIGRVAGYPGGLGTLSNNYAYSEMTVDSVKITADNTNSDFGENNKHGADVDEHSCNYGDYGTGGGSGYYDQEFWEITLGWEDFDEHWKMPESSKLPILKGFPEGTQDPRIQDIVP